MNIIGFTDVNPQDPESFALFLDMNDLAHEAVFGALLGKGLVMSHYPMHTDTADTDWLESHNQEHQSWSTALNVSPPSNLSIVDFGNQVSAKAWLNAHARHHSLISGALGL